MINNVSSAARQNGIPKLDAEKSNNLTLGFGLKPSKDFTFTLDYYNIKVKDRVLLSNEIAFEVDTNNKPTNRQSFFVNGMDTKTSGVDVVASYRNILLGSGKLALNFSGNYTFENERDGAVKDPQSIKNLSGPLANQTVIDATQEALLFTSRPKFKYIFGGDYEIGKFGFSLNNTVFGPTKFKNAGMSDDLRIEFLTKVVTDLGVTFSATEKLTVSLNVNNLLNVLPEWQFKAENAAGTALINNAVGIKEQSNLITFNQRYSQMTYDGYHFSQLGTMFNLSLNYKF